MFDAKVIWFNFYRKYSNSCSECKIRENCFNDTDTDDGFCLVWKVLKLVDETINDRFVTDLE